MQNNEEKLRFHKNVYPNHSIEFQRFENRRIRNEKHMLFGFVHISNIDISTFASGALSPIGTIKSRRRKKNHTLISLFIFFDKTLYFWLSEFSLGMLSLTRNESFLPDKIMLHWWMKKKTI